MFTDLVCLISALEPILVYDAAIFQEDDAVGMGGDTRVMRDEDERLPKVIDRAS
jgi:hypothetical protein